MFYGQYWTKMPTETIYKLRGFYEITTKVRIGGELRIDETGLIKDGGVFDLNTGAKLIRRSARGDLANVLEEKVNMFLILSNPNEPFELMCFLKGAANGKDFSSDYKGTIRIKGKRVKDSSEEKIYTIELTLTK
jgi:hypothetical protein